MIDVDDNYYDDMMEEELGNPSRAHPRYGMEVELFPHEEYIETDPYDEDNNEYYGGYTSSSGKFGSVVFSSEILNELERKIDDKLIWGADGDNLEIRTFPSTKKKTIKQIKPLFDGGFKCFPTDQTNSAGIHIHSDIRNYTPSEIYRNVKFITSRADGMYTLLRKISRRHIRQAGEYGWIPNFQAYERSITNEEQSIREGIFLWSVHGTHEFRMFNSSTDFTEAISCLDFVDAVLHFSRDKSVWEESAKVFQNYVFENEEKFPYLVQVLRSN